MRKDPPIRDAEIPTNKIDDEPGDEEVRKTLGDPQDQQQTHQ
jgi:hypothetical protein